MEIQLIGTDPEFFIKQKGKFKSSIPIVGMGTKEHPMPMEKAGFSFHSDNVAVEWGQPPTNDLSEFKQHINYAFAYILDNLPEGYEISKEASAYFDEEELMDPRTKESGCDPSFCIWTGNENPKVDLSTSLLRAAGGHIHIQTSDIDEIDMQDIIKYLDLYLGVPSIMMDTDLHRRSMYGKAGEYRSKIEQNRFEYRTLSNFWIFDEKLTDWVWKGIQRAVEEATYESINTESDLAYTIQHCINTGDLTEAMELINYYKIETTNLVKV